MPPSIFNATWGNANEWDLNSAGYLNPWIWVTDSNGARPDSYYDRFRFMTLVINGYGY